MHQLYLHCLTDSVVRVSSNFDPQNISNTLWYFATLGLRLSDPLLHCLIDSVVRVSLDFNAQEVSNTLWSFAVIRCSDVPLELCLRASSLSVDDSPDRELSQLHYAHLASNRDGLARMVCSLQSCSLAHSRCPSKRPRTSESPISSEVSSLLWNRSGSLQRWKRSPLTAPSLSTLSYWLREGGGSQSKWMGLLISQ